MAKVAVCAYIAGLIDGDGCLNLTTSKDTRGGKIRYYPRAQIVIINRKPLFLEKVKTLIGFGCGPHKRKAGFGGYVYGLHIASNSDVASLVKMIDPYSIGKRAELDVFKEGFRYMLQGNIDIEYFREHYVYPLQNLNRKRVIRVMQ